MTTRQIICALVLFIALLFKFWMVIGMEITDDTNDPFHYMEQILLHRGFCYGPGTGDVGKLFYEIGVPFRLGIETCFLVSTLAAVKALLGWPTRSYLALGLYLLVAFDPAMEELLSHLMSDQVWLVETLAGFSCFVFFARTSGKIRWTCITLAALFLGFSTITRTIFVPLMATFLVWGLVAGALSYVKGRRGAAHFPLVGGCLLCLYAVALFYYSTCYVNSRSNGFFGLSAFDCREYQDFYMCLQSVGEPTGDPYYPIDDERLNLIAQAGPRSRWFVDQLGLDTSFRHTSQLTYGKPELALCWFHWAVFETIDQDGDITRSFAIFQDVEKEIATAAREKRLKVRMIIPLPDCRVPIVLSAVPRALRHVAWLTSWEPSRYAWAWNADEPRFEDPDFSRALHRVRVTPSPLRAQIGSGLCAIYSWLYAPLLPGLVLAVAAFVVGLTHRWRQLPAFTADFLNRQIFLVAFVIFYLWYVLFDASGLYAVARYLLFNHIMLPLLLAYYARKSCQLLLGSSDAVTL